MLRVNFWKLSDSLSVGYYTIDTLSVADLTLNVKARTKADVVIIASLLQTTLV